MDKQKALLILEKNNVPYSQKGMLYYDHDDYLKLDDDSELKQAIKYLSKECSYAIADTKFILAKRTNWFKDKKINNE